MEGRLTVFRIPVVAGGEVVLEVSFQLGVLFSTLSEENIGEIPFLGLLSNSRLFGSGEFVKWSSTVFGSYMVQEDSVLSGYADCSSNINLGVEPFIPLFVGHDLLAEAIESTFLLIDGGERVLIFRLCQDSLLDQL